MRRLLITLFLCAGFLATATAAPAEDHCYRLATYGPCEQALVVCTQVINSSQDRESVAIALVNRGVCHKKMGNPQAALADYSRSLQLKPDSPTALTNRCLAYKHLRQYQNALADCTRSIAVKPDSPDAYGARGGIFYKLDRYQEALTDHSSAIRLAPQQGRALDQPGLDLSHAQAVPEGRRRLL